jgi:hypothetical protein
MFVSDKEPADEVAKAFSSDEQCPVSPCDVTSARRPAPHGLWSQGSNRFNLIRTSAFPPLRESRFRLNP